MGTIAGTWLKVKQCLELDDRKVLNVLINNGVALLSMCDSVYQNTMTFEMTAALRAAIPCLKKEVRVIILSSSLDHFHAGLNPAKAREWVKLPTCHVAASMKECYMGFVEVATLGIL